MIPQNANRSYGSKLPTTDLNQRTAFDIYWLCCKERRVDALALRADERRDKLRKASDKSLNGGKGDGMNVRVWWDAGNRYK